MALMMAEEKYPACIGSCGSGGPCPVPELCEDDGMEVVRFVVVVVAILVGVAGYVAMLWAGAA